MNGHLADVTRRLRAAGCVFAEDEAALLVGHATTSAELDALIAERAAGTPLELLLGWAAFHGHRVSVAPGVFVPRRRTEHLVDVAVALVRPGEVVLDLCCGSGAVGLAEAAAVGRVELHACDLDPAAVACAQRNMGTVGGQVHRGDLFDALPRALLSGIDLVVVNAPYVPTDELALLPAAARLHEPALALDGGTDGLDVHRRVARAVRPWLAADSHVVIETSRHQAAGTAALFSDAGLVTRVVRDEQRRAVAVVGAVPTNAPIGSRR